MYQCCRGAALWLVRIGKGLFYLCYGGHTLQLQGILEVTRKGPEVNDACAQVRLQLSGKHRDKLVASRATLTYCQSRLRLHRLSSLVAFWEAEGAGKAHTRMYLVRLSQ